MADTAHRDEEFLKEHFDTPEELDRKAQYLAQMMKESRHLVVFTGAGISTSAGIPDFRGPEGVWTLASQKKQRTRPSTNSTKAIPTPTHMSLVQLQNADILKYVISQNCDGLHRKSGIHPQKISELHGNSNLERCVKCSKEYLRDFAAVASYRESIRDHRTGRKCSLCGGDLVDSIVNFGESLPEAPLNHAIDHSNQSDLSVVLGSSLTVHPACEMPKRTVKRGGRLVICNLQKTPLDHLATLRIFAKADDLMKLVMRYLHLSIPSFILERRLVVSQKEHSIQLRGEEQDGTPTSFLRGVEVLSPTPSILSEEPFHIPYKGQGGVSLQLHFMGHYNEPPLALTLTPPSRSPLYLRYDPLLGKWTTAHEPLYIPKIPPATPPSPSKFNVTIGNSHRVLPRSSGHADNIHEWTIFVADTDGRNCGEYLSEVEFQLHPTFAPSRISIGVPPFSLTRIGWGIFPVDVKMKFRNGKVERASHMLSFQGDGSQNEMSFTHEK